MAPVAKLFDDLTRRLDFPRGGRILATFLNSKRLLEIAELCVLLIDEIGVLLESLEALCVNRMLQFGNGERVDEVIFTARTRY